MASNSIPYFPEFEAYSDNASARWKRWLSRFKNMMVAMNVDDNVLMMRVKERYCCITRVNKYMTYLKL